MSNSIQIKNGKKAANGLKLAVCSIVRDCDKNLKKNISIINQLVGYFHQHIIIVYENDSIDQTKTILGNWRNDPLRNVVIECHDFGTRTIPEAKETSANKYFSRLRISKMVEYRNRYLEKLEKLDFQPDYLLVVDLDVYKISLDGIFHSFGLRDKWDVVTANGISLSPKLKYRYHDSYALVEENNKDMPQTESSIKEASNKWGTLSSNAPLLKVFSAYGGLSIYRYRVLENLRYRVIENNDNRVEVRCEHFALCYDIRKKGFKRIFVNPMMKLTYQKLNWRSIKHYAFNRLNDRLTS